MAAERPGRVILDDAFLLLIRAVNDARTANKGEKRSRRGVKLPAENARQLEARLRELRDMCEEMRVAIRDGGDEALSR